MIRRIGQNTLLLIARSNKSNSMICKMPIFVNNFSTKGGSIKSVDDERVPPPPAVNAADAWEEVRVPEGIYYWNTVTDETTAIGAPKPTGPTAVGPPNTTGQSLLGVMAEGAAWGVGMSIARNVVGSMFGGSIPGSEDDDTHHV